VYLICDIIEGQDAGDWKVGSGKWAAVRSLGLPDPWAMFLSNFWLTFYLQA